MYKIGIVKSLKNDNAIVEINRVSACGENCASCKGGCAPTGMLVTAKNPINAGIGQYVKLEMEKQKVLKAAFLVYIVPLIGLVLGILLGTWLAPSFGIIQFGELFAVGVGFLFLMVFYGGLNYIDRRINETGGMEVVIKEVIS